MNLRRKSKMGFERNTERIVAKLDTETQRSKTVAKQKSGFGGSVVSLDFGSQIGWASRRHGKVVTSGMAKGVGMYG